MSQLRDPDPLITSDAVRSWFVDAEIIDEEEIPTGEQLRLLTELASHNAELGLFDGLNGPALWRCCPDAGSCWRGAEDHHPPTAGGRSGLSLPWVGPKYVRGGVAILGMNLRDAGGPLVEYEIACRTAGEQAQLARLSAGFRRIHNSSFGYRSTRSAAAVLDWLDGSVVTDQEQPELLAGYLERIARLQHVKCSPDDGARSSPTEAMTQNCPPRLLRGELELLRPTALLTFGDDVRETLEAMPDYTVIDGTDWLSWGTLELGDQSAEVFSLYHPAASRNYWANGQADLIAELRSRRGREPRFDVALERRILGAALLSDRALPGITQLNSNAFLAPEHREVFSAICSLHARDEPVDVLTVEWELERSGRLEGAGGFQAVSALASVVPVRNAIAKDLSHLTQWAARRAG